MHPVQIAVLIALVGGSIIYIWHQIRRDIRAEREFFRSLVEQLSSVLLPKGLHLTQRADLSKSVRGTIATFEGPVFSLEVFWDYVEREVILFQCEARQPRSERSRVGWSYLPRFPKADAFAKATADIVEPAARSDGNAFLKPARFEVRDVFEITDRGRVVSGTILAGRFRVGTRVWAEHTPRVSFTISDVGFADDIGRKQSWVAFFSENAPPLTELRQVLSPGSIVTDADPVGEAS